MKQKTEKESNTKNTSLSSPPAARMAAFPFFLLFFFLFPSSSLSQSPADSLLKFKTSLSPQNVFANWAPATDPCRDRWRYVRCSSQNGPLIGLNLVNLHLSGALDVDALLPFPDLRTLSLENNSFAGPIPPFNKHPGIRALYLCNNNFTGEIPPDYFNTSVPFRKIWLCGNRFTGEIPSSLTQIPTLTELHLERNQFSGQLPPLKAPQALAVFNASNNKLEGQIPESYAKFNASSFAGNDGLCGKPLGKECAPAAAESGSAAATTEAQSIPLGTHTNRLAMTVLIIIVIVLVILAFINKQRVSDFSRLGKEGMDNSVVDVQVRESQAPVQKDGAAAAAGLAASDGGAVGGSKKERKNVMNDLVMLDQEKPVFGMQDLMKAAAEVLGNGSLGSAYKATMGNGLSVVVKRVKDMSRLPKEAFEAEMRRMGRFRNSNVLTPLSYHYRREEKLIVSEHVALGSLLYVLHGDKGSIHAKLNWATRLKIVKGIAKGLSFIHKQYPRCEVPHGNLKSSNVLLTQDYDPLLNDYAFQPMISTTHVQALFAYKAPEYAQSQQVSHKSDIYCLGILILEILTGKLPAQYLNSTQGAVDVVQWVHSDNMKEEELIDPEIVRESESVEQMVRLLRVGVACTESNPDQRPNLEEASRRIEEVKS